MAWQSKAADFPGASVEHVEQYTFPLPDPDRLALSEHLAVDAEQFVAEFVPPWPFELFLGLFADLLQIFD
jgi:hypothetical protein